MNQKGFATIFGLCLILVIALVVKGIQGAEGNHPYETNDFQVEIDLQNAADSGIYEMAEKIRENPSLLPLNVEYSQSTETRKKYQVKLLSTTKKTSTGDIKVEVWVERMTIEPYRVDHTKTGKDKKDKKTKTVANPLKNGDNERIYWTGYTFFSKAEFDSERIGGKLYRRSFAYIVDKIITEKTIIEYGIKKKDFEFANADADLKKKIHFMDIVSENYYYKE